ncbi:hypothetical protein LZ496_01955 [Sphingomonas sp. NSE70-1]|uniref:Uncharacterized protein n=1 Tax=Sphingomonas caseinilyticus TaxID=2908205 RepID=A0ABT0RRB5_9SPHN|nr:hypothetical protein [Sphingomonas caseinilyticus]MCL6697549.1 hypothetical protein [Sphingomonas caseinilyticus]
MRISSSLAAAILILISTTAAASLQPINQTIVVKATRLNPSEARQRAVDFVKSTGVANGQKQVARWAVPICINVVGVSTPQAAKIEDLMLGVARQADVPVAQGDCDPNINVIFTADASGVVKLVHRRKPHQLRELSLADRERLLTGSAPVRWWNSTEAMDRDGVRSNNISPGWVSAGKSGGAGAVTDPVTIGGVGEITSTQQYNSGSHVRTPTIRSIYGATIVVDVTKIGVVGVNSISAYAAMVAFAEIDEGAPPPDSILGLFEPSIIESSLTDWDMAFLNSLYRMPLDRRARIQRGHLVEALLDERLAEKTKYENPD